MLRDLVIQIGDMAGGAMARRAPRTTLDSIRLLRNLWIFLVMSIRCCFGWWDSSGHHFMDILGHEHSLLFWLVGFVRASFYGYSCTKRNSRYASAFACHACQHAQRTHQCLCLKDHNDSFKPFEFDQKAAFENIGCIARWLPARIGSLLRYHSIGCVEAFRKNIKVYHASLLHAFNGIGIAQFERVALPKITPCQFAMIRSITSQTASDSFGVVFLHIPCSGRGIHFHVDHDEFSSIHSEREY
jgi:hypothetical protein